MAKKNSILKPKKVLPTSESAEKMIESISKKIGSKDLFPGKEHLLRRHYELLRHYQFDTYS